MRIKMAKVKTLNLGKVVFESDNISECEQFVELMSKIKRIN